MLCMHISRWGEGGGRGRVGLDPTSLAASLSVGTRARQSTDGAGAAPLWTSRVPHHHLHGQV